MKDSTKSINQSSFSGVRNIPNFFTLLNLLFGCIAIVLILQTGESIVLMDDGGATQVALPEKIWWGALFIFAAAAVDFLDGFLARLLKANSAMGEQLDSLSDMVSFGVAPGIILYQLLRISFAQAQDGLDVSIIYLLPAFLFTGAVAWRLAKFNISNNQKYNFQGVPSPAAGLVVASLPLIILYQYFNIQAMVINKWLLYGLIFFLSFLMLSNRSFIGLKFTNFSIQNNLLKYILIAISIIAIFTLQWLAVPVIFISYVILSTFSRQTTESRKQELNETMDITV